MAKRKKTGKRPAPSARQRSKASKRRKVSPIPPGAHTITPYLTVRDAAAAIDFYKRAFGAKELHRMASPDGKVMHADIKIGDSHIFLSDEFPGADTKSPTA